MITLTTRLLGRRPDEASAVELARHHKVAFYRLVPLSRGFLVFELRSPWGVAS